MKHLVVPKQFKDLIFIDGDSAETDSLRVADKFNKRHADVIRAIENLECSAEFREANFFESTYVDEIGKVQKYYDMARDGFYILAMGFTGREAMAWKEKFIEAFNWMASALRTQYEQKALADKERYEKRMQERRINDAIEADKQARLSYEAGALETKCKALAIADKSAQDMIDKATQNYTFELMKRDLKIDQLTGKVMRLEAEIGRLRQGGAHRRNRK